MQTKSWNGINQGLNEKDLPLKANLLLTSLYILYMATFAHQNGTINAEINSSYLPVNVS